MIRRAIWLLAGAGLGIAGYRRMIRMVRAGRARRPGTATGTAAFIRDVRTGMAEYMDRHRDA
jgi:hypothetical protein